MLILMQVKRNFFCQPLWFLHGEHGRYYFKIKFTATQHQIECLVSYIPQCFPQNQECYPPYYHCTDQVFSFLIISLLYSHFDPQEINLSFFPIFFVVLSFFSIFLYVNRSTTSSYKLHWKLLTNAISIV